jgi:xanthine/uracil permease
LTSSVAGAVVVSIGLDLFRRRNEKMKSDAVFWDSFFISLKNFSIIFSALLIFTTYFSNYQNFSSPQKIATVVCIFLGEMIWWGVWISIFWMIKKEVLMLQG